MTIPAFLKRATLSAEMIRLRADLTRLTPKDLLPRMRIVGRILAIRKELGADATQAPAAAPVVAQTATDQRESTEIELPRADDDADDVPPDDEPIGAARNPSAHLYNYDPNRKPAQRRRENAAAIALLQQVRAGEVDGASLTEDQKATLAKYSGTGGNLVGEDGKKGSAFEYYTPKPIAEGVWELARELGFSGGRALDPCGGVGVFGGTAPANAVVDAIELNETSGMVNKLVNQGPGYTCTISSFEKVAAATPDETHDLVITNIPFGDLADRGGNQHDDPRYKTEPLEGYFILRSLEKLKPGGLALFICPTRTVSGKGAREVGIRTRAAHMAEFLGAYRLPSSLFLTAGTETTTDVVVFRKHGRAGAEKIAELIEQDPARLISANVLWQPFISGNYFADEGRRFVLGTEERVRGNFDSEKLLIKSDKSPADIARLMRKFGGSRIDWEAIDAAPTDPIAYNDGDTIIQAGQTLKLQYGQWVPVAGDVAADRAGAAAAADLLYPMTAFKAGVTWAQALSFAEHSTRMGLTQDWSDWFRAALAGVKAVAPAERDRVWRVAVIAMAASQALDYHQATERGFNYEAEYPELSAAIKTHISDANVPAAVGSVVKGAARVMRTTFNRKTGFSGVWRGAVEQRATDTRDEAQRFEAAKYVGGQGGWVSIEDARKILGEELDPFTDDEWCVSADGQSIIKADDLFVGNYADGLAKLRDDAAKATDERVREKILAQIEVAHTRVQRVDTGAINFNLFSPFATLEEKAEFMRRFFDEGFHIAFGDDGKPFIDYKTSKSINDSDDEGERKKLMARMVGYLKNGTVTLSGAKVRNERAALERLRGEVQRANEQFNSWARSNDGILARLNEQANDPAKLYFRQVADESPMAIPGWRMGEPPNGMTPHGYQFAEIRRKGRHFGGINGYGVGLGKTATAMACVQHVQNIGVKLKTVFVVPNSVLSNWRKEAMTAYTEETLSRCLFVGLSTARDGKMVVRPADYDRDLNVIAEDRHNKIFMTYEAFKRLRMRDTTIDRYVGYLRTVDASFAESDSKAQDEKSKTRGSDLAVALSDGKPASAPYLEDLGIDSLVIDEAHVAKNSAKSAAFKSAKFLSLADTSAVGDDLQAKAWYIRGLSPAKDGVVGLTATPVTNSPLEIYAMMSLVAGRERINDMALGVNGADQFLEMICRVESEEDETLDGIQRDTRVFKGLDNVDVLRRIIGDVCTIETADTVGMTIKLPDQDDSTASVSLDAASLEEMKRYKGAFRFAIDELMERSENRGSKSDYDYVEAKFGEPMNLIGHPFNMLRKLSALIMDPELDQRATIFTATDKARAETVVAQFNALKVIEERELPGPRGQGAIVGTIVRKDGDDKKTFHKVHVQAILDGARIIIDSIDPSTQDRFGAIAEKAGVELDVTIPPKLAAMLENFRREESNPRGVDSDGNPTPRVKQIIFCDMLATHDKIRRLLIKHAGVQAGSIAIITGQKNNKPEQIIEVQNGFNADGPENRYRVIIANEKAEVGINLQRGTQAIHHLTLGWTPDSLTQRNGRGVRQGNKTDRVTVYSYDAEGTFDSYKRGMVGKKADWIDAVMSVAGGSTVDIEGGISRADQELLIDIAGDADAVSRFQADRDAKEREARATTTRGKQMVNLRTIEASRKFLAENESVIGWVARKLMQHHTLSSQAEKLRDRIADPKTSAQASIKHQGTLGNIEAQIRGLDQLVNEALVRNQGDRWTIDSIRTRAIKRGTRGIPDASTFASILSDMGVKPAESSALRDEWTSEVDQAKGMLTESVAGFKRYAESEGGAPAGVADAFVAGDADILDGKPITPGAIIITADGEILVRRAAYGYHRSTPYVGWSGTRISETTASAISGKFEVHNPGSAGYADAAVKAAAYEDRKIGENGGKIPYGGGDLLFARAVPEIAAARGIKGLTPVYGSVHLPAPCLPLAIKRSDAQGSEILEYFYGLQSRHVQESDGGEMLLIEGYSQPDTGRNRGNVTVVAEYVRATGKSITVAELKRINPYQTARNFIQWFMRADRTDLRGALSGDTKEQIETSAIAWIKAAAPGLIMADDEALAAIDLADYTGWKAMTAMIRAIEQPAAAPAVEVAVEAAALKPAAQDAPSMADNDWVGLKGVGTKANKEVIKAIASEVQSASTDGGYGYQWIGEPVFQWNVRYRALKALRSRRPDLMRPGYIDVVDYVPKK